MTAAAVPTAVPTAAPGSTPRTASETWEVWGLEASVVVTDPQALPAAARVVREVVGGVDEACSRFRPDSELARLRRELVNGVEVGPMLARLVKKALEAAEWTDGDVDPTLGDALAALGYDRDLRSVDPFALGEWPEAAVVPSIPGWKRVYLEGRTLRIPEDVVLDLGATAKAVAADLAVERIARELGCGVLVSLGGDLATAGPAPAGCRPAGHWGILVQDTDADPGQLVALARGRAMATSSTQKRRWRHAGRDVHHILDPRFGLPVENTWRTATVSAKSCVRANALSTAAIVRGHGAVRWLEGLGAAARLVDSAGNIITTAGWPAEAYDPAREAGIYG